MSDDGATLALDEALSGVATASRGAALLHARGEAPDLDTAAELPLARAAAVALDELRTRAGPVLGTVVDCPGCRTSLDVPLMLGDLAATTDPAPSTEVRVPGAVVRAPTTADVLAALSAPDPGEALSRRCVRWDSEATVGATMQEPVRDPDVLAAVEQTAERLAGAADTSVHLDCPACGAEVTAAVDLVELLTDRVADDATRVIAVVAELASVYGWSEREVLALPDARRAAYLEQARHGARFR